MESIDEAEVALRAAEQGQVQAWTRYPPTPWWFYPGIGGGWGLMVASIRAIDVNLALGMGMLLAGGLIFGAIIGRYRVMRGQFPVTKAPRELRPVMAGYVVLYGVFSLAMVAVTLLTNLWPATPLIAAIFFAASGAPYERIYRRAADKAERRVGL